MIEVVDLSKRRTNEKANQTQKNQSKKIAKDDHNDTVDMSELEDLSKKK